MDNYCNRPGNVSDIGNMFSECECRQNNSGCRNCRQNCVPPAMPPIQPALSITVGNTVTGAPGTPASVVNRGTPQNAILDFIIPQGIAGQAAVVAYGGLYNASGTSVTLTADAPITLPLESAMAQNGTVAANNGITVSISGNYAVEYSVSATTSAASTVTAELTVNGVAVAGGTSTVTAAASEKIKFGVRLITALTAGSTVALRLTSSDGTVLTLPVGTGAYLTVEKLG